MATGGEASRHVSEESSTEDEIPDTIHIPVRDKPGSETTIPMGVALDKYIQTELPILSKQDPRSIMFPATFTPKTKEELEHNKSNESRRSQLLTSTLPSSVTYSQEKPKIDKSKRQGNEAERIVFENLKCTKILGVVFHGRPYINNKKNGIGKGFKEHDFVILTADKKLCLVEVKCCADRPGNNIEKLFNNNEIKDNRRNGEKQLGTHLTLLSEKYRIPSSSVGQLLIWPFLHRCNINGDERFSNVKSSEVKHAFREECQDQENFSRFLNDYLNNLQPLPDDKWTAVSRWFTLLGCGAVVDAIIGEVNKKVILLSQEQLSILYRHNDERSSNDPLVCHGPAGSGKTLLILLKICQLSEEKYIGPDNKCLVLTCLHGSGVVTFLKKCLSEINLQHVLIKPFPDLSKIFETWCRENMDTFTHIFVDSAEDIVWYGNVSKSIALLKSTIKKGSQGNFCLMMDQSQMVHNLNDKEEAFSHKELKPVVILSKSYRLTENILRFINNCLPEKGNNREDTNTSNDISLGHDVTGFPVSCVNQDDFVSPEETICKLIIDLCGKDIKPNDIVLFTFPMITARGCDIGIINAGFQQFFKDIRHAPEGILGVDFFNENKQKHHFCVSSVASYKGLDAKVVILHCGNTRHVTRNMLYTMASRCLSLLIVVWSAKNTVGLIKTDSLVLHEFTVEDFDLSDFFRQRAVEKEAWEERMRNVDNRLETFTSYHRSQEITSNHRSQEIANLARNGFIQVQVNGGQVQSEIISCVYCGFITHSWQSHFKPIKEHEIFSPGCEMVATKSYLTRTDD